MSLILDALLKQNLNLHLANCFNSRMASYGILYRLGVRAGQVPAWDASAPEDWWQEVVIKLDDGLILNGIAKLLQACAAEYPGHELFAPHAAYEDQPDNRSSNRSRVELVLPTNLDPELMFAIIARAAAYTENNGSNFKLDMVRMGSTRISISTKGLSAEEVDAMNQEMQQIMAEYQVEGTTQITENTFSEYYMEPLRVEGPDSRVFEIDQIPASTSVKDLARGVINEYADEVWPSRKGQKSQAVIDKVSPDGTSSQRLDPRMSLHDAGVRPNDTLRVSPERTAGAIHPMLRDAALARVCNEVLDYAAAHPGFEVEANSLVAPTEYVFKFHAPGFAPPRHEGAPPTPIDYHEALVELSPDFPIKAPEVWWQSAIFHPNIHPEHGWVCLGGLQEHYRPSMNFGELCQMLLDLASYRNYAVIELHGRDIKGAALDSAAAFWAISDAGQAAIYGIGGTSLFSKIISDDGKPPAIKFR